MIFNIAIRVFLTIKWNFPMMSIQCSNPAGISTMRCNIIQRLSNGTPSTRRAINITTAQRAIKNWTIFFKTRGKSASTYCTNAVEMKGVATLSDPTPLHLYLIWNSWLWVLLNEGALSLALHSVPGHLGPVLLCNLFISRFPTHDKYSTKPMIYSYHVPSPVLHNF